MDQQMQMDHSWKIRVRVTATNFYFKFKATSFSPTCKFYHFSILLRLRNCFFNLQSDSTMSVPRKPRRKFKSSFLNLLQNLKICRPHNSDVSAHKTQHSQLKSTNEKLVCLGSWVIGFVGFLFKSISGRCPPPLSFLVFLLKKCIPGSRTSLFLMVLCLVLFYFAQYLSCILWTFQALQGLWGSDLGKRNWVSGIFTH